MPKKIFVLDGHPAPSSLSHTFAETYADAARTAGHDVRVMHLNSLTFDLDFGVSKFRDAKPLEPDLEELIDAMRWSDHMVLCTPMWWGGLPGKLKCMIDRAFLPGLTFDTRVPEGKMPKPMLQGRTARIILTSDTPGWIFALMYRNALLHQLRGQIFGFVGFKPVRITRFAGAGHVNQASLKRWTDKVAALGSRGA